MDVCKFMSFTSPKKHSPFRAVNLPPQHFLSQLQFESEEKGETNITDLSFRSCLYLSVDLV